MHFLYFECLLYIYTVGMPAWCLGVKSLRPIFVLQKRATECSSTLRRYCLTVCSEKGFCWDPLACFVPCCFYSENPSVPPPAAVHITHMHAQRFTYTPTPNPSPTAHSSQWGEIGGRSGSKRMQVGVSYYGSQSDRASLKAQRRGWHHCQ